MFNKDFELEQSIYKIFQKHNYKLLRNGALNVIGIRNNVFPLRNRFDDTMVLFRSDETLLESFNMTTDPGSYFINHPINKKGTAKLIPGQYKSYIIGKHKNKYKALVQRGGGVFVERDKGLVEWGYFGINIHRASKNKLVKFVERYSAGCQVVQDYNDFEFLMNEIEKDRVKYGIKIFTYTLLLLSDFVMLGATDTLFHNLKIKGIDYEK